MVEFKSKFNAEKLDSMNKHAQKKINWLIIWFIGLMLLLAAIKFLDGDIVGGVIFVIISALLYPLYVILIKVSAKKYADSMPAVSDETVEIYRFYEDKMQIIQTKGDVFESTTTARYTYLFKAEKTEKNYFLYISQGQAHVIDAASLTEGTLEEFDEILTNNLGAKFTVTKK